MKPRPKAKGKGGFHGRNKFKRATKRSERFQARSRQERDARRALEQPEDGEDQ